MEVGPHEDWRFGEMVLDPPPASQPIFTLPPASTSATPLWPVQQIIDGAFFLAATGLVLWLGWVVVAIGIDGWFVVGSIVLFWILLAYVGLPRVQEVLTRIYLPDYFIGRSVTAIGVLGDPVNLALDGTEADIHAAMARAGWVRADELTVHSSWGIVVSSVLRRPYPAAPVSPLFLFDQAQAFAYQQEVNGNASQRHHVRFWQVPEGWLLPGGFRVTWLASATYDKAVGLSLFTLQPTHRVDADIDIERDYVIDTVRYAVPGARLRRIKDYSSAFTTRNGGGDVVHTDGNLPILDLAALHTPAPETGAVAQGLGSRALSHRLPPPGLLAAALLSAANAVIALVSVVVAFLQGPVHPSATELTLMGIAAACELALWGLVLTHRGWARNVLMVVCGIEAVTQLLDLGAVGESDFPLLVNTGITVLVLIALSSNDAARWMRIRRRNSSPR
jgi:hypothetical protein